MLAGIGGGLFAAQALIFALFAAMALRAGNSYKQRFF